MEIATSTIATHITDDIDGEGGSGLRKIVRSSIRNEKTMDFAKNSQKMIRAKGNGKADRLLLWALVGYWCIHIFYIDESYLCFENRTG